MAEPKQILVYATAVERALYSIILVLSPGQEKAPTYQFGDEGKKGLPCLLGVGAAR